MAVVRELVTLLGTEVDPKGFHEYERGIERVKALAINAGKLIGIAFSIDKIVEFADSLVSAGKEVNRLVGQLKAIARPMDDIDTLQQGVFETAQKLGVEYAGVLATFKEFYSQMRETTVPADQILQTTENIYKSLQVGRASAEQITQTMDLFSRSFRRGGMRSVGIGMLEQLSPALVDKLMEHFKVKSITDLREIAKAGKITAAEIVKALGQSDAELNEKWSKTPQKLGKVFTRIFNDLVNVTAQIYKLADASVFMGQMVWWVWTRFTSVIKTVTQSLGGLKNVIELVGIAIGVSLIRPLIYATAITIRWGIASAAALLPWLLMAAAIAGIALALQDLIYWVQGKKNLIGTFVGPFEDLKENFKSLDIFAGFRFISDVFKGDWEAAFRDLKIALTDTKAIVLELTALVVATFAVWQFIKFWNLITSIGAVKAEVVAVEGAAKALGPAFSGANTGATTLLGTLGRISLLLGAIAFLYWAVKPSKTVDQASENAGLGRPEGNADPFFAHSTETPSADAKPLSSITGGTNAGRKRAWQQWVNRNLGWTGIHLGPRESTDASLMVDPATAMMLGGDMPMPLGDPTGGVQARNNWIGRNFGTAVPGIKSLNKQDWLSSGTLSGMPSIPPGAIGGGIGGGPTTNNVQPTFNQNVGGITVNTTLDAEQIGRVVSEKVTTLSGATFDAFARSLQVSSPRVEAPTQ